jgi:hypothetical protein
MKFAAGVPFLPAAATVRDGGDLAFGANLRVQEMLCADLP